MNSIMITIKKELRSIFRDKKTIVTLLLFPILIPVMIFLYANVYESQQEGEDYLIGVNYSVNNVEATLLSDAHLRTKEYSSLEEMEDAYLKKEILGYIDYILDEEKYVLYTNCDSSDGMYVHNYVQMYLDNYNHYLARLTLMEENIDVEKVYHNFSYEVVDLEGENWMLMMMFTVAFTYIIMSIVISTTNMATTATAVEKENGTLETLLTFPIRSRDLVIGKYLATVIIGVISSFIGLFLTIFSLEVVTHQFQVFEGITYTVHASSVMLSMLIVVLASFFVAGVSIALTSFAKSYKEAQSISSVLNVLTIIPMMISLMGVSIQRVFYLIPILNYTQVLMDIFSLKMDMISISMVIISSFVYVGVVISYIIYQYRSEKVLFGRNY